MSKFLVKKSKFDEKIDILRQIGIRVRPKKLGQKSNLAKKYDI